LRTPCVRAICGIVKTSLPKKSATAYAPESTIPANTAPDAIRNSRRAVGSSNDFASERNATASIAMLIENPSPAPIFSPGEMTNPAATTNGMVSTIITNVANHRRLPRRCANCSAAAAIVAVANPAK